MKSDRETMEQKLMWKFTRRMLEDEDSFVRRPQRHRRDLNKKLSDKPKTGFFFFKLQNRRSQSDAKNINSVQRS